MKLRTILFATVRALFAGGFSHLVFEGALQQAVWGAGFDPRPGSR